MIVTNSAPARRIRASLLLFICLAPLLRGADIRPDRLAWKSPAAGGTPPAQVPGDTAAVRFTATFADRSTRVSWDAPLALDLRAAAGFTLRLRVPPGHAGGRLFLYLKSGSGWYGTAITPAAGAEWQTVTVWKASLFLEGIPAGWRSIQGLRVALTRTEPARATVDLGPIALLEADPRLVLLRNTAALRGASPQTARSLGDFPERVHRALLRNGLRPTLLDDPDLTGGYLRGHGARVVFLPYNPSLPATSAEAVAAHLASGGTAIGFFMPPPALLSPLGLRPGAYVQATAVPGGFGAMRLRPGALAGAPTSVRQASWMIQSLQPASERTRVLATWLNAQGEDTGHAALLAGPRGFWFSHVYLDSDPDAGARLLLALAARDLPDLWRQAAAAALTELAPGGRPGSDPALDRLRAEARTFFAAGRYPETLDKAAECREAPERRMLAALAARPGEFRGAWCHRAYGIPGWSWEQSLRHLKACGFNAILPQVAWAGAADYASRVLPPSAWAAAHGDQLRACSQAAERHGIAVHAWVSCFNLGDALSAKQSDVLAAAGRLQHDARGRRNDRWLCPSHPANRRQVVAVALELATEYRVAGVHLDFVRLADADHCYCINCRQAFEQSLGAPVGDWPAAVRSDSALRQRWLQFRCDTVTSVLREVRSTLRQKAPACQLSAAVFDHPDTARTAVGQDWAAWCRAGLLDLLLPMDYTAEEAHFRSLVSRQVQAVAGTPVRLYPGIGARAARLSAIQVGRQIALARDLGAPGFAIFEYHYDEAMDLFPALATGPTRPQP